MPWCVYACFRLLTIVTIGTLTVFLLYNNGNRQKSVFFVIVIVSIMCYYCGKIK